MAQASNKVTRSATGKQPKAASKTIAKQAPNPAREAVAIKPAAKAPDVSANPAVTTSPAAPKSPFQTLIAGEESYLDLAFTRPQDAAEAINEQITTANEMFRRLTQTFLDQSRNGYGQYKGNLEEANQSLQQSLEAVAEDIQALRLKRLELMQMQCQAGFDLAKSLITADGFANALQLALGFAQKQGDAFAQGQKEVAGLTCHMTKNCLAPFYAAMKCDPFGFSAPRAA